MTRWRYPEPPDGDDLDVSGIAYFDRVGDELVASASATANRRRSKQWARPALLTGVAAAAAVVGFVGFQVVGSEQMVEAIDIQRLDDRTVITVDELIDDPTAVQAELAAAGIATNVRGILAPPPSRVGALISVETLVADGNEVEVETEDRDGDRSVDLIVIPEGFSGSLEFGIGVSGAADLGLEFAGPPADCEALILRPLGDVVDEIDELSGDVTWLRNTTDGVMPGSFDQIPPTDVVIELLAFPGGRLEVTTTDDLDRIAFSAPPCEM